VFHLIGVEHSVQSISVNGPEAAHHMEYRACLEQAIHTYKPTVVGEEYSQDSLNRAAYVNREPQEFFTRKIAVRAGVKHMLCDPDLKARMAMGYQSPYCWSQLISCLWERVADSERDSLSRGLEIVFDIPIREQYWLNQLKSLFEKDIIFVCGDSHVESFADLLSSQKLLSKVVRRKIGMTPELIQQSDLELQYARTNRDRIQQIYQKIQEQNGGTIPAPYYPGVS
jgi:hypothetical protein